MKFVKSATITGEDSHFEKDKPFHSNHRIVNLHLDFSKFKYGPRYGKFQKNLPTFTKGLKARVACILMSIIRTPISLQNAEQLKLLLTETKICKSVADFITKCFHGEDIATVTRK